MKKISATLAAIVLAFCCGSAGAAYLDDAASFVIGRSFKLGADTNVNVMGKKSSEKCLSGLYRSNGICKKCSDAMTGCKDCTSESKCLTCAESYALDNGKCVKVACSADSDCGSKQYCIDAGTADADCSDLNCDSFSYAEDHECKACTTTLSHCQQCSDKNTCTQCDDGYPLINGKCESVACSADSDCAFDELCYSAGTADAYCEKVVCDDNQYLENRACSDCSANCEKCTGSHSCVKCEAGYAVNAAGDCEPAVCDSSEYWSDNLKKCTPCTDSLDKCQTCSSETTCLTCEENYKVVSGKCVLKTCAEISSSYKTSCGSGYDKTATGKTGSDGACYTCTEIGGWCDTSSDCGTDEKCVSNACVTKTCAEINSSYSTSCGSGYNKNSTGKYGSDGACYTCSLKTCAQQGYVTGCGTWYDATSAGTGSDGDCYSCSAKSCPPNLSTNQNCGSGKAFVASTSYSGESVCGHCTTVDPCADVTCSGGKTCSNGSCVCPSSKSHEVNGTCYECTSDSHCGSTQYCYNSSGTPSKGGSCDSDCSQVCPVGYREGGKLPYLPGTCSSGTQVVSSTSCNGRSCWGCAAATCTNPCSDSGFSTSQTCSPGYISVATKKDCSNTVQCYSCMACTANCETCNAPNSPTCTKCKSGYTLSNGSCSAPSCTYTTEAACKSAYHTTTCSKDSNGCYVKGSTCASGYWKGPTDTGICRTCPANYSTCSGTTLTCKDGYSNNGGGDCTACASRCATCKIGGGPNACLTCKSSSPYLIGGYCCSTSTFSTATCQ